MIRNKQFPVSEATERATHKSKSYCKGCHKLTRVNKLILIDGKYLCGRCRKRESNIIWT